MSDRQALFEAVRPFAEGRRFSQPMVDTIDRLGDLLGLPRIEGGEAPTPFPIGAIDASLLKLVAPALSDADAAAWAAAIRKACAANEINTIRRVAAFVGQTAVESQGYTRRRESLNYSVAGLLSGFGRHRISAEDAKRLGRNPNEQRLPEERQRQIANLLYGGEFGRTQLGNTQPDDGWVFRGTGPIQVTGRGNMTRFAQAIGMPLDKALEYAATLEGGVAASAWFWEANDINRLADTPGVSDETKRINGGANALAERAAAFDKLVAELLRREKAQ